MGFKKISAAQHDLFVSALKAGRYNLLLGAGASMDSENSFGKFPSGQDFKNELCALKKINPNYSLQRAYSLLNTGEIEINVTARFAGARPGPTANLIASFIWKRIFSWNIDDTLEQAYKQKTARQFLNSLHYSDDFAEPDTLLNLLLIHLHGTVLAPDKGYVFSRSEYANNIKNISHWMVILSQVLKTEPVIISGTSLDEIDLEFYLSHRSPASSRDDRGPSILVERTDDAITEDICKKHELLHFVGHSHDFFEYCDKLIPHRPSPAELVPTDIKNLIPAGTTNIAALGFQSDFEIVPASAEKVSGQSRFLFGHVPNWSDLASDLDVSRSIVGKLLRHVDKSFQSADLEPQLLLISDSSGVGKTTILRRVGFELAQKYRVLLCSSLGRLHRATADILNLIEGPLILVVDNFADQASPIVDILASIEKRDIIVIGAERSHRQNFIRKMLSGVKYEFFSNVILEQKEINQLIDLYIDNGLVGDHSLLHNRSRFANKLKDDPIAIACCRIMKDFSPLQRIVESLVRSVSQVDLDRYLIVSIAQQSFAGGVRYEILNGATITNGLKQQMQSDHPLPITFSDTDRTFVIPENTILADRVLAWVSETDQTRLLKCFVALGNQIAPWVNRSMIIRRTPEARMSGRLFHYEDIVSRFIDDFGDEFYRQTRDAWRWNSRYWDQLSILNLSRYYRNPNSTEGNDRMKDAVQHARHAVSIELHPFTLSTLGKVLMAQSASAKGQEVKIFGEAFDNLTRAIELESATWFKSAPQPYASLFNGTINFLSNGFKLSNAQAEVLKRNIDLALGRFPKDSEIQILLGKISTYLS